LVIVSALPAVCKNLFPAARFNGYRPSRGARLMGRRAGATGIQEKSMQKDQKNASGKLAEDAAPAGAQSQPRPANAPAAADMGNAQKERGGGNAATAGKAGGTDASAGAAMAGAPGRDAPGSADRDAGGTVGGAARPADAGGGSPAAGAAVAGGTGLGETASADNMRNDEGNVGLSGSAGSAGGQSPASGVIGGRPEGGNSPAPGGTGAGAGVTSATGGSGKV
jgi:hypothetical protein